MDAVAGLLLMLLGVSHGVETYCDGRQVGAQCYGALGGTVDIRLIDSTSAPKYRLLKNSSKILDLRNNAVIPNITGNKYLFIPSNRRLRIINLSGNDSGNYTSQTFDSDGRFSNEWTLQVLIQAPVSSVLLFSECLSQGEMRVSCCSEGGDSPQYSWTLDGRTLTDAELLSGDNETNNITLKQHVSGDLVCSVRNNVSNVSKKERLPACGFIFVNCTSWNGTQISGWVREDNNTLCTELTTQTAVSKESVTVSDQNSTNFTLFSQVLSSDYQLYIMISGVLLALVIFLVVGIAVICALGRKENNKPTKREDECDEEVTYADVRFMKCQKKEVEHSTELEAEAEVEYGQVKLLASAD